MTALPMYTTTTASASWTNNVVFYGGSSSAVTVGYDPPKVKPRPKTNLERLHDQVEATCARARLAA